MGRQPSVLVLQTLPGFMNVDCVWDPIIWDPERRAKELVAELLPRFEADSDRLKLGEIRTLYDAAWEMISSYYEAGRTTEAVALFRRLAPVWNVLVCKEFTPRNRHFFSLPVTKLAPDITQTFSRRFGIVMARRTSTGGLED